MKHALPPRPKISTLKRSAGPPEGSGLSSGYTGVARTLVYKGTRCSPDPRYGKTTAAPGPALSPAPGGGRIEYTGVARTR